MPPRISDLVRTLGGPACVPIVLSLESRQGPPAQTHSRSERRRLHWLILVVEPAGRVACGLMIGLISFRSGPTD